MESNKFKIGNTYQVETNLQTGTYKVIAIVPNKGIRGYGSETKTVVYYQPLSGNILEKEDEYDEFNFSIESNFAQNSSLLYSRKKITLRPQDKLLLILASVVIVPIVLFTFLPIDIAFYASIFIDLFLMCWGIEIFANEANKHFDH